MSTHLSDTRANLCCILVHVLVYLRAWFLAKIQDHTAHRWLNVVENLKICQMEDSEL